MERASVLSLLLCVLFLGECCKGLLYPRESESREVKVLDGVWNFRADYSPGRNAGFVDMWYTEPLSDSGEVIFMPVPSSFNDITQNSSLRDYIGWVWYDRGFWVPKAWKDGKTRIFLRFESAHYNTIAWVNGKQVANHSGGHLPFEADVTELVSTGEENRVTVAVNNTLTPHTLPCGSVTHHGPPRYPEGYTVQNLQFDFFNYAGIHRSVKLYTTPATGHIEDITVTTSLDGNGSALLSYSVQTSDSKEVVVKVELLDRRGRLVGSAYSVGTRSKGCGITCESASLGLSANGSIVVSKPNLWWPWTMSADPAYLYTLVVMATVGTTSTDVYRLPVGIRTVLVSGTQFLINGRPFYFLGVDKHEDADIRGKGLDYPLIVKDINLLKWLGVNAFRTSHYPYSEELMDLCDRTGIVVIDESTAVGLQHVDNFANVTLEHHLQVMEELVQRDKNRPSVVMWSLANEPDSGLKEAEYYFKTVAEKTRSLDPTRPLTFACNHEYTDDLATQFVDVIAINRYYAWYSDAGHLEVISYQLSYELDHWFAAKGKPMIISEYGAGTIAGFHKDPAVLFTEDYQSQFMSKYFQVYDTYREKFLIGELVWNFADFETAQESTRVDGNKKGVLTRQRQPKAAALLLRNRYTALGQGKPPGSCHLY